MPVEIAGKDFMQQGRATLKHTVFIESKHHTADCKDLTADRTMFQIPQRQQAPLCARSETQHDPTQPASQAAAETD